MCVYSLPGQCLLSYVYSVFWTAISGKRLTAPQSVEPLEGMAVSQCFELVLSQIVVKCAGCPYDGRSFELDTTVVPFRLMC